MINKKKIGKWTGILVLALFIVWFGIRQVSFQNEKQSPRDYVAELGKEDQKLVQIYAALYDKSDQEVAKMKQEKRDWKKVNEALERDFFIIPEQKKFDLVQEGYKIEDLYEAEAMSKRTGRKAMELAKAKGKAGEKKWSEVVKDEEIKSVEEQLGLTDDQIQELKEKKYSEDERIEIALLCMNQKITYEDIMKELKQGKSIREMKEETENGKK